MSTSVSSDHRFAAFSDPVLYNYNCMDSAQDLLRHRINPLPFADSLYKHFLFIISVTGRRSVSLFFIKENLPVFVAGRIHGFPVCIFPVASARTYQLTSSSVHSPSIWAIMFSSNTATLLRQFTDSFPNSTSSCTSTAASEAELCRDDDAALFLKTVAIVSILLSSVIGVAIPLVKHRFLRANSNLFVAAKAFAAGVILATGFVHMLPDGSSNLSDPCLPEFPWSKFPFAGFLAMMAALVTLVADFVGTQLYEKKQQEQKVGKGRKRKEGKVGGGDGVEDVLLEDSDSDSVGESGMGNSVGDEVKGNVVFGEEDGGGMHIVGIRAHAAHHRHSHPHHGQKGCDAHVIEFDYGGRDVHGHIHGHDAEEEEEGGGARHVVVSQVLELGIVSHSVIIGLSLGVSNSPCTIRPLIAALSFHQFFEGFALGGCISQAQFRTLSTVVMACFFAITTPAGIAGGIGLSSFYDPDSPRALIIEGILGCISAGILVYMALVDLIAADYMNKRMRCSFRLQVISYFALFLGALLMSAIAVWE